MKKIFRSVLLSSILVNNSYSNIPFDTKVIDTSIKNNLWNNIQRSNEIGFLRGKTIVLLGGGIICCIGLIYGLRYYFSDSLLNLAKSKIGWFSENGSVSSEDFAKAVEKLPKEGSKRKIADFFCNFCNENRNKNITIKRYSYEDYTEYTFNYMNSNDVKIDLCVDSNNYYWLHVHNCLKSDSIDWVHSIVQGNSFRENISKMVFNDYCNGLVSGVLDVFEEDGVCSSGTDNERFSIYDNDKKICAYIYCRSDPFLTLAKREIGETNDSRSVSLDDFAEAVKELHEGGLKYKIANVLYKFCNDDNNRNKKITIERYGEGYIFSYINSDKVKVDLRVYRNNNYWLKVNNCLKSDSIGFFFSIVQNNFAQNNLFKANISKTSFSDYRDQLIFDVLNIFDNEDQRWVLYNNEYFLTYCSGVSVSIYCNRLQF